MVLNEATGLSGVDPDAVTVSALIQGEVRPFVPEQIVSARRAFHDVGPPLGGEPFDARGFLLLADEVGFPAGEVLGFVSVKADSVGHTELGFIPSSYICGGQ